MAKSPAQLAKEAYDAQPWSSHLDEMNEPGIREFIDAQSPGRFSGGTYNQDYDVSKARDFFSRHINREPAAPGEAPYSVVQGTMRYGQPPQRSAEDFLALGRSRLMELAERVQPGVSARMATVPPGSAAERHHLGVLAEQLAAHQRGSTMAKVHPTATRAQDLTKGTATVVRNDLPEFARRPSGKPYNGGYDTIALRRFLQLGREGEEGALDLTKPSPLGQTLRGVVKRAEPIVDAAAKATGVVTAPLRWMGRGLEAPYDIGKRLLGEGASRIGVNVGGVRLYQNLGKSDILGAGGLALGGSLGSGLLGPVGPVMRGVGVAKLAGMAMRGVGNALSGEGWRQSARKLAEAIIVDPNPALSKTVKNTALRLIRALETDRTDIARAMMLLLSTNAQARLSTQDPVEAAS